MAKDRILVTAIQEHLGNTTLTIRVDGVVIGSAVQDTKHRWIVRKHPPPDPHEVASLQEGIEWLLEQLP